MSLREKLSNNLKSAMKNKETDRLSTLRLINAAIKDRDISLRGEGQTDGAADADILAILAKMVKQRHESARSYEEAGRLELAERELAEVSVIEGFLPRQLSDEEIAKAIAETIEQTEAASIRDIGKVIGALKSQYNGQMDFGRVGPMVKDHLV